ncbi:probable F-box protein At4g22030 [Gastrolobium bilobum]|uniref:probable F-box protein At4g22030 n=1 Tax=Gastrolobium bilobum TaxID=150636 RepID=UPI002AB0C7EF|nr:probable F-box protein At4g22030 [Gastrolobium bilobum]
MGTFLVSSRVSSFSRSSTRRIPATNNVSKIQVIKISTPRLPRRSLVAKLDYLNNYSSVTNTAHLHLIMEIVADRVEMHKNIGVQRDDWNHLLLTSVNMITFSAATMAGLAAVSSSGAPLLALKVSSTILYIAATGFLMIMNKIQPSQLAEEQRNAARLFKQLHGELRTRLSFGDPTESDVTEAMEKLLALDRAYPLPLLGSMLEKFPQTVEPAVWWPPQKQRYQKQERFGGKLEGNNGWDAKLEEEMKEIVMVLKKKDIAEYLRLSKKVLNLNKILAVSGPLLTGLAALGSVNASWPVMLGVIGGALAGVVNTLEHGGQVGMVFELYRATTGFFKLMEESIELNINEQDPNKRENGELFEIKVALQLGRSISELREFAAALDEENGCEEFASKLF